MASHVDRDCVAGREPRIGRFAYEALTKPERRSQHVPQHMYKSTVSISTNGET